MNLYFETPHHFEFLGIPCTANHHEKHYVVVYDAKGGWGSPRSVRLMLGISSDRVWKEDPIGKVAFLKNRIDDVDSEVDMEEFAFVKLKAKEYKE